MRKNDYPLPPAKKFADIEKLNFSQQDIMGMDAYQLRIALSAYMDMAQHCPGCSKILKAVEKKNIVIEMEKEKREARRLENGKMPPQSLGK